MDNRNSGKKGSSRDESKSHGDWQSWEPPWWTHPELNKHSSPKNSRMQQLLSILSTEIPKFLRHRDYYVFPIHHPSSDLFCFCVSMYRAELYFFPKDFKQEEENTDLT